jgi:predicted RNA-binding Zn-ribbon protein involved in translation (DUF1610 family)
MNCPHCGSTRIRRSHTRGFREKFLKFFGYKAFQCREADCGWRGLVKTRADGRAESRKLFRSIGKRKGPFYPGDNHTVFLLIIIILLFLLLLFYLIRE